MENENSVISKVDVRIIVSGLDIAEVVSKSVDNTQLERDYNIIVSSIIPTNNFEIAKKVAKNQIGDANDHAVVKHMLATMKKQDLYKK